MSNMPPIEEVIFVYESIFHNQYLKFGLPVLFYSGHLSITSSFATLQIANLQAALTSVSTLTRLKFSMEVKQISHDAI